MVKYVKEIKANLENITTLILSDIDEDRVELRVNVEKSLKRLVSQTLVQKNGDIYSFLTNEEQDITRAINQVHVELGEIINEASNVVFQDIFLDTKYQYNKRYNFPINQAVDERYRGGQSADIGVRIITPYYELRNSNNDSQTILSPQSEIEKANTILRGLSEENNEVIVHLIHDLTFLEEIEELLKINKYLTKQSAELSHSSKSILIAKQEEASEKRDRIKLFLEEALKQADIYVKGDKVDIKEKNPIDRINEALKKLVNKIYHKLSYMKTSPMELDIQNILRNINQNNFGKTENVDNSLAIDDLNSFIEQETRAHAKPSLNTILHKFKKAPYGFVDLDIEWLIATLFAQKRIYLIKNSQNISLKTNSVEEILRFLTKKEFKDKILIDKKADTEIDDIKNAKDILKEFFDVPNIRDDDETIMEIFQDKSQLRYHEIEKIIVEYQLESRYPGKNVISKSKELLQDINNTNSLKEFFNYLQENKNRFFRYIL